MKIKKCPRCRTYTLKEKCPHCQTKTIESSKKFKQKFLKTKDLPKNI